MAKSGATSRDYSFAREPFWLFSHVFAASVIALFLFFCFGWQLPRHGERADRNELIEARSFGEPIAVDTAFGQPLEELDFTAVQAEGRWLEADLIRVANRSQGGRAGEWQVGLFETDQGTRLLVNRGFVLRDVDGVAPVGDSVTGWLRETRVQERFGVADTGEGERVPRLDIDALEARFDEDFAPMWLQLESPSTEGEFPEPVPLPELTGGPHLSYAVQWLIFATLGVIVYTLLLRKRADERARSRSSEEPILQ